MSEQKFQVPEIIADVCFSAVALWDSSEWKMRYKYIIIIIMLRFV